MSKLPTFDPRQVPWSSVALAAGPVAAPELQAERLRRRFGMAKPWQLELEGDSHGGISPKKPAAVLIALVFASHPSDPLVLLTERSHHLSSHSGQIAFPGGRIDAGDASAAAAALREAHEEVGLSPAAVELIGEMPPYSTGSGYLITPVLGLVQELGALKANPHEVADIFQVPLSFLMNPLYHRRHSALWQGQMRHWYSMPYTDPHRPETERFIWGVTAGILRNLYHCLQTPLV